MLSVKNTFLLNFDFFLIVLPFAFRFLSSFFFNFFFVCHQSWTAFWFLKYVFFLLLLIKLSKIISFSLVAQIHWYQVNWMLCFTWWESILTIIAIESNVNKLTAMIFNQKTTFLMRKALILSSQLLRKPIG